MKAGARNTNKLWTFQGPALHAIKTEERPKSSDRGKVKEFAVMATFRRRHEQLKELSKEIQKEQEIQEQREQRISSAERIATTASSAALASATHRSKTAIENFDEQIIHYREKKSPVPHSRIEPDYMTEHRSALLQKQLLLPRRSAIQKDLPEWYKENAANMPDWFELRKLLDAAEPPPHKSLHKSLQRLDSNNIEFSFQRSESGNLKGVKPMVRSMSTEPRIQDRGGGGSGKDVSFLLDRAYSPGERYGEEQERGGNSGGQRKRTSFVGNGSKSNDAIQGTKSGGHSQMRGEVPSEATVAERLADQTLHVLKRQARKFHKKTLVSGSLKSPADTLLEKSSLSYTLHRYPPFGIETANRDTSQDPPPYVCEVPVKQDKGEQFAWWSRRWADLTAQKERSLEDTSDVYIPKPIKPVENFWMGNFQKRPVPWRKEQLGAYPSYKDFPWPPPRRSVEKEQHDEVRQHHVSQNIPWSIDRERFRGPSEPTLLQIVMPSYVNTRVCPDFTFRHCDLSNSFTTLPEGKSWRPRAISGWGGYKQTQGDLQYDNSSRRMFANEIERMLGIVADKILSQGSAKGVIPEGSAMSFLRELSLFEPNPRTGFLNRLQFQVALKHFGAEFPDDDERDLFSSFATIQDGKLKVNAQIFAEALAQYGLAHPLGH